MALPNIDERCAEVAGLASYGVSFTPVVFQALTEKFGCSSSAMADLKLIAQRRNAPHPGTVQNPCATDTKSTYARLA